MAALAAAEEAYGGRAEVLGTLSEIEDPRAKKLLELMADPRRGQQSLVDLCCDAGVAPSTLLTLLRDAMFTRTLAESQMRMARRMGKVVDRVADAAEGHFDHCRCTNGGQRAAQENCPICKGTGQAWNKPSLMHQKLFMEATELLKTGGPMVQVNQGVQVNTGAGAGTGFFDSLTKGLAGALRPVVVNAPAATTAPMALRDDDPVVEATVLDAADLPSNPPQPAEPNQPQSNGDHPS